MRLGVFGGVFNPPHIGHLICAQEALVQLELDVVVFVPVADAPHREIEDDPGAAARFAMCQQAVATDERFTVSRIELDRDGPSYTVDTLAELRRRAPDDELFLILGGDEAASLTTAWRAPEEVLRLATVAAVERDGGRREEILKRLAPLEGADRIVFFSMPRVDVSSTLVRRRAAAGLPIRYLVPDTVANYIGAQRLYGAPAPVGAG